jgi:hypothetical protein
MLKTMTHSARAVSTMKMFLAPLRHVVVSVIAAVCSSEWLSFNL